MIKPIISLAALISALSFAFGCKADHEVPSTEAATAAPKEVLLTATNYAYQAPDTILAGWTTFRMVNDGAVMHAAQVIKLEEGRTLEEFLEAYDVAWRTVGPRPEWGRRIGGPGAVEPGDTSNTTLYLEPGSYAWYCPMNLEDGVPHFLGKDMARPFTVAPRGEGTQSQLAPESTATIRLVDYAFDVSAPLRVGRNVIRVENLGPEPHEVGLARIAPGKTMGDVEVWLMDPQGPPPATALGGVNALAANTVAYFEADLTPGDYVLLCFVTAPDGRPHVAHGMIRHIRVG